MQMTESQRVTLKNFIQADATLGPKAAAGDYDGVANGLNALAAGPFVVWQSTVPTDLVFGAVSLAAFTPTDNPPVSPSADLTYQNRAFQCQLKQGNFFAMTSSRSGQIVTAKVNVRQALNDSLTNIPSGASGALADAGWLGGNGVRLTIQRNATVAEKVLASGTGTSVTPGNLGVFASTSNQYCEGVIGAGDISGILA